MRAIIFDLDGTLVDSVYAHVLAWQRAFQEADLAIEGWRIHRHIGMSGDLMMDAVLKERGFKVPAGAKKKIDTRHAKFLHELLPDVSPLSGAVDLLKTLRKHQVLHAIATSGNQKDLEYAVKHLKLAKDTVMVFRQQVADGKPEPDLFLEAGKRLGVPAQECYAVGDAVWDLIGAKRASMVPIGILSGGYAETELRGAGAFRVFKNPEGLLANLDSLNLVTNAQTEEPRSKRRYEEAERLMRVPARKRRAQHSGLEVQRQSRPRLAGKR